MPDFIESASLSESSGRERIRDSRNGSARFRGPKVDSPPVTLIINQFTDLLNGVND
jgi:hypothetical protein